MELYKTVRVIQDEKQGVTRLKLSKYERLVPALIYEVDGDTHLEGIECDWH